MPQYYIYLFKKSHSGLLLCMHRRWSKIKSWEVRDKTIKPPFLVFDFPRIMPKRLMILSAWVSLRRPFSVSQWPLSCGAPETQHLCATLQGADTKSLGFRLYKRVEYSLGQVSQLLPIYALGFIFLFIFLSTYIPPLYYLKYFLSLFFF